MTFLIRLSIALEDTRIRKVMWLDGTGSQFDESDIRIILKRVKPLAGGNQLEAERFGFAPRRCVGDQYLVSDLGGESVAFGGKFGGDPFVLLSKRRDQQQESSVNRLLPFERQAGRAEPMGLADNDRAGAAQQNGQAVLFNRRVEAADDGDAQTAHEPSEVVGLEDHVARALPRTDQGQFLPPEQGRIAQRLCTASRRINSLGLFRLLRLLSRLQHGI